MSARSVIWASGVRSMNGSQEGTHESTKELVAQAIDQGKRLAQAEFEAARQELREDALEAIKGLGLLGAGAGLGLAGAIALSVSLALALRTRPVYVTLLAGLGLLGGAAAVALQGVRLLPKEPMAQSIEQVKQDLEMVREQLT
jgi:hypothetical protein